MKISQLVPMIGTVGGLGLLILIGFEDIKFSLEPTYIWTFMAITLGSTVAHKTVKKWKSKQE